MTSCKYMAMFLILLSANYVMAQETTQQRTIRDQSGQATQPAQSSQYRQTDQSRQQQSQVGQAGRLGSAQQGGELDTLIASCLLLGNQEEVALAQMAVQQAESQEVKQFAQKLIDDHQKAIQKLQQHAKPGISLTGASATAASDSSRESSAQLYTANRQDLNRDTAGSGLMDKILKMDQQAVQECLTMTKSMMQEKQGAEFDKAFAGMQVGAHVGMLAKLKASESQASPQLASIIQESQQTVKQHLEEAKQLCEQLESAR